MKNFGIIHILFFILLMLVYRCAAAQDYVATIKGDTLYGEVRPFSYGTEKRVQVIGKDKKKTTFSILQTKGFSLHNEIYHPVRMQTGYVFMKVIKPGYLSLYGFQVQNQPAYDGLYLLKKDGSGLEVPNLGFKKIMSKFLEDCDSVSEKIQNGTLGKKDIHRMVDEYNHWIESNSGTPNELGTAGQQKLTAWNLLEEKLKATADFEEKDNALEMITEIKSKINRNEKIPNFLLEGLKSSLAKTNLQPELDNALKEIAN